MNRYNSRTASSVRMASMLLALVAGAAAGDKIEIEIYCPTDVDVVSNGVISSFDLLVVAAVFGECDATCTSDAPTGASTCMGDVNGNCYVGALDLAYTMGHLGACGCLGDLDGNGARDDADLAALDAILAAATPPIDCRGDIDNNGRIDRYDELAVDLTTAGDGDGEAWWPSPVSDPRANRADVNGDDTVDSEDQDLVSSGIGRDCRGDLNHDGWIDEADKVLLEEILGSACH